MAARQRLQSGGVALQRLAAPGLGDWRRWRRPTTETTQTAVGVSVERAVEPEHIILSGKSLTAWKEQVLLTQAMVFFFFCI